MIRKNTFYKILACFVLVQGLFLIEAKAQNFKAGLVLGGVASQVDGDRMGGFYKAGLSAGLFVYRDLSPVSRIQGELLFTMKGSRTKPKNLDYSLLQVSTNEIDINLMYIYKYSDRLHFRLGLTPTVLITSREETETGVPSIEAPPFRRFGLSGLAGITYNFSERFGLTWAYHYSLFSIRSGDAEIYNLYFVEQNRQRHSIMSFTFGYRF